MTLTAAATASADSAQTGHGRSAFQAMEREGVRVSLRNLRTFPWVKQREDDGRLKLHGAVFSISDGILYLCDEDKGGFAPA